VVMWLNSQRSILTNDTLSQRGWSGDDRTSELLVSMMDCIKLARSLRRDSTAGSHWITKGCVCEAVQRGSV
jgi:hypothetical protein